MIPELEKAIAKFLQSYIEMQEENGDLKDAAERSEKETAIDKNYINTLGNNVRRLESEKADLHRDLNAANARIDQLQSELAELSEKFNKKPLKWGDPAEWVDERWYIMIDRNFDHKLWRYIQPEARDKILYLDDILALIDDSEVGQ